MTLYELKIKLKDKAWQYLKDPLYFQRESEPCTIQNINFNCDPEQKKVIICYETKCYFMNLGKKTIDRTQPYEIMKIINVFSGFGYAIDFINCLDTRALEIVKDKKYDVIFGFGENFYQLTYLHPDAKSILYMTENHPEFSYREEKKRVDYFYERYGRRIEISRSGKYYKLAHLEKVYSSVISMGETRLLLKQYSNPYSIFPTGLINPDYKFSDKDQQKSKKHFLWMGSAGAVHKGLDLLLDVFNKRDDIVLHICGLRKNEKKELRMSINDNIIDYGHISVKSDLFLQLVEKCSFIILPSCSEACSTAVTTGMLHGLIPVVMKDAGFTRLGDNAIFLEDYKIDYIDKKLTDISNRESESLSLFSRQVFDFARQNFTIQVFENNFKTIISDILAKQ